MKNTLKNFIAYNFRSTDYNTLFWTSNRADTISSSINDNTYENTLDSESYIPILRFRSIRFELSKLKMSDIREVNYLAMSDNKYYYIVELSIDEAIDELLYMDNAPEYLLEIIDFSDEDAIIDFVERYYEEVGPMFEENGNLIIKL